MPNQAETQSTNNPLQNEFLSRPAFIDAFLEQVGQTGILVTDSSGIVHYANKRAIRLLGAPGKKIVGTSVQTIQLFDERGQHMEEKRTPIWGVFHNKRYKQVTPFFCYYKQDAKPVSIALKATQVLEEKKLAGAVIEIREATRKLNIDEMKTLFLSFAAHQLKTPSSIVRGFLELLIREGKKSFKPEQWDNILSAFEANDQLIRLSKTLLNLTKLEGGMIEPSLSSFNIKEIVEQKIAANRLMLQYKGIVAAFNSSKIVSFETDSVFFSELFEILFSNAIKYAPEGSTITVQLKITPEQLRLEVADQGEGLTSQQQNELFTTAQKANPYDNSHGLGLLMAQKYLALLGGSIGVSSKKGQGSSFYFTIPAPI